jgi:hypothetical protein
VTIAAEMRWDGGSRRSSVLAYSTNYLVDVHAGVILDVEATAAHRTGETDAARTMLTLN